MTYPLAKLYPGLVIGVSDPMHPLSEIIEVSETFGKHFLSQNVATHIQISYRKHDLNKVVEMGLSGIQENDVSEDAEGVFKHWGDHIVFIAAPIDWDDYVGQEQSNKILESYLKHPYRYALKELFNWWGLHYEEGSHEKICSTLQLKWCQDLGLPHPDATLYSPWKVQAFYEATHKLIYKCY